MDIKDIILTRRKQLGYSLEHLAGLVGVSKQTVQKWESGKISNMKRSNIAALSVALGVSIEDLMGWSTETANEGDRRTAHISEQEQKLLNLFRQIPEDQQALVAGMIEAALKSQGLL